MKRKTTKVADVLKLVNDILKNSKDSLVPQREGQALVLEQILHSTGNYHGFRYLDANDMKTSSIGTTVGVREFNGQTKRWNFDKTDRTRVQYF
jgi:hypothetical protein